MTELRSGPAEGSLAFILARTSVAASTVAIACLVPSASAALITVGPGGPAAGYKFAQIADEVAPAQAGDVIHAATRAENAPRFSYAAFDLDASAPGVELTWGFSPGVMEIGGDMRVGPNAALFFELAGTDNSQALTSGRVQYDTVFVDGNFTLNGSMNVSLSGAYVPQLGHAFELVATDGAVTTTGVLSLHVILPTLSGGLSWSLSTGASTCASQGYAGQSIFATILPGPGNLALLSAAGITGARRRR